MSARLTLCGPEAGERLLPLVAACHAERGLALDDAHRQGALAPLLEGSPYGAVYLIGPARAPVGYLVVTFSWSIEAGGMEAALEDLWLRPAIRGRGMAGEAVSGLLASLKEAGVTAVTLDAAAESPAHRLGRRLGFAPDDRALRMLRRL